MMENLEYWRRYAETALGHPPLPKGPHHHVVTGAISDAKQPTRAKPTAAECEKAIGGVPSVAELYPILWELYANVPESAAFREPVNALDMEVWDYYKVITAPMSLHTILDNVAGRCYSLPSQVMSDLDLVWNNCIAYNGAQSVFGKQAEFCRKWVEDHLAKQNEKKLASTDEIARLMSAIELCGDDDLLDEISALVKLEAPELIADGELEMSKLRVGLLHKLRALVDKRTALGTKRKRTEQ